MAPEKYKSLWITFLLLAAPLGIVFGYAVTAAVIQNGSSPEDGGDWEWAFRIQGAGLVPFIVLLILMPAKYMNLE